MCMLMLIRNYYVCCRSVLLAFFFLLTEQTFLFRANNYTGVLEQKLCTLKQSIQAGKELLRRPGHLENNINKTCLKNSTKINCKMLFLLLLSYITLWSIMLIGSIVFSQYSSVIMNIELKTFSFLSQLSCTEQNRTEQFLIVVS